MAILRAFLDNHPRIAAFGGLATGMVIVLFVLARDVALAPSQWAAIVGATIVLAGLCVWIIHWD
ncbi:MAG: hypothetical protein HYX92_16085 [Chloroflexi bacterium]|nr:hypothetical protein [Chloroflexota bacterium]